jgi:hypothetical protein
MTAPVLLRRCAHLSGTTRRLLSEFPIQFSNSHDNSVVEPSLRANGSRECAPDDRLREAIHGRNKKKDGLLRFARNDVALTPDTRSRLAARSARAVHTTIRLRKQRAQGTPGARCTRSLVCSVLVAHECSHHRYPGTPGIPCAMVLTVSFVLSPVTGLCCHRRQRI